MLNLGKRLDVFDRERCHRKALKRYVRVEERFHREWCQRKPVKRQVQVERGGGGGTWQEL